MAFERSRIERQSRWLRSLINSVLLLLIGVIGLDIFFAVQVSLSSRALAVVLLVRLPVIFYLAAIWSMRMATSQLANGVMFDLFFPKLLTRVGWALALGALTSVLIGPLLQRAMLGNHFGGLAAFDPAAIAVGMVGLLLAILARLLEQAANMRLELEEIL
jgi:Protein of unknown function (DUF2975)